MSATPLQTASEFVPTTAGELARFVAQNFTGEKRKLYPVGGRTALHHGYPADPGGVTVSLAKLKQIRDYPARDMTITVGAGIRIDELAATLRAEGQQLPIDVPQPNRATLGGIVAMNTSGTRRFGYGTLRDYVIGIEAVDGQGRLFHSGGRVVKNVAGYDLCKLLVGSLGTLAVVTEVTLKLRPLAEHTTLVWKRADSAADAERLLAGLLTSATRPIAVDLLNASGSEQVAGDSQQALPSAPFVLIVGFAGLEGDVAWQVEQLHREFAAAPGATGRISDNEAQQVLAALTEFQTLSDDPVTFRASVLPSRVVEFVSRATELDVSIQAHAGNGIVVGHLPDTATTLEKAGAIVRSLRELATSCQGHLVVMNCDPAWQRGLKLFGGAGTSAGLTQRVKKAFDPENLLNPGRYVEA